MQRVQLLRQCSQRKMFGQLMAALFLLVPGVLTTRAQSGSSAPVDTTKKSVEAYDKLFKTLKPGQQIAYVGDMGFRVDVLKRWRDHLAGQSPSGIGTKGAFDWDNYLSWPNGRIPYLFDSSVPANVKSLFLAGVFEWQKAADIRWEAKTSSDADYVRVKYSASGTMDSSVGRTKGQQVINLNNQATVIECAHEIGHCLGMIHEQCRTDRDKYITITSGTPGFDPLTNINWAKVPNSYNTAAYDWDSVMHYGYDDGYKDTNGNSYYAHIRAKAAANAHWTDGNFTNGEIGQAGGPNPHLSDLDKGVMGAEYGGGISVSGRVTSGGVGVPGIKVNCSGVGVTKYYGTYDPAGTVVPATTDANGYYTLPGTSAGRFLLTPSGGTFTPVNKTVTTTSASLTNIDFTVADSTKPTTTITMPVVSATPYSSVTTATGTGEDNIGVDYVKIALFNRTDSKWWNWNTQNWGSTSFSEITNTKRVESATNSKRFDWTTSLPQLGGGAYTVEAIAVDVSGNDAGAYTLRNYDIDGTGPKATITAPVSSPDYASFTAASGAADDNLGVDYVKVALRNNADGKWWDWTIGNWGTTSFTSSTNNKKVDNASNSAHFAWSVTIPSFGTGTYSFQVIGVDVSGIDGGTYANTDFTIDQTGPSVAVLSPGNNATVTTLSAISGTASDTNGINSSVVNFTLNHNSQYWNGTSWQTAQATLVANVSSGSWSSTLVPTGINLTDGIYYISASAKDGLNNLSTSQKDINQTSFNVDNAPPTCAITSPANGSTVTTSAYSFNGSATDSGGMDVVNLFIRRIGDGKFWDGSTWVTVTNLAPIITSTYDGSTHLWSNTGTLNGRLPLPGSNSSTQLSNGQYDFTAVARDKAGNTTQADAIITVDFHQVYTWTGYTLRDDGNDPNHLDDSTSWGTAANWSPNGVPGPEDIAVIGNGDTVTSQVARTVYGFTLGGNSGLNLDTGVGGVTSLTTTKTGNWTSGVMYGNWAVSAGAILTISSSSQKFLADGCTLTNFGIVNWTGGDIHADGNTNTYATINNKSGGVFTATSSGMFSRTYDRGATFTNFAGATFVKTGAGTTTQCDWAFNNNGTSRVDSGTLALHGDSTGVGTYTTNGSGLTRFIAATHNLGTGAAFTGSGKAQIDGAGINLTGATTVGTAGAASTLEVISGALYGAGSMDVRGALNWTGGTLGAGGTVVNVLSGSTWQISGTATKEAGDGSTINNSGTATWSAGDIHADGNTNTYATINNKSGGVFTATSSGMFSRTYDRGAAFVNSGLLNLGAKTLTINWDFSQTSTGTLQSTLNSATVYGKMVATGSVALDGALAVQLGGTYTPALGAAFKIIDPSAAVSGTFAGLPEGAALTVGSRTFQTTYQGGDGDDVILSNQLGLSISDPATVTEGNSGTTNLKFTVRLAATNTKPVKVDYATADGTATAGSDYSATTGTLTIAAGQTSGDILVPVNGDTNFEADETFKLDLSNPVNAFLSNTQATGTITNDDSATLGINSVSILEGNKGDANKSLNFTVTLSDKLLQAVTVKYATSGANLSAAMAGADYVTTSGTLTIPAGLTSGNISVPIIGDNLNEDNESFFVTLSQPTNAIIVAGGQHGGIGTIIDNDALPILSSSNITVVEGTGGTKTANFTINLNTVSGRDVQFTCNTTDGTARTPSDYTPTRVNLTIPAGQTTAKFSVPVITDSTDEYDENFYAFLTAPVNAKISTTRVICTVTDDDAAPLVSITNTAAKEYNGGTTSSTFHINLSAPSGKVVKVNLITANRPAGTGVFPATANVDYVPVSSTTPITISISAGSTVGIAHVTINGDVLDEEDETFLAKISAPENATLDTAKSSAVGTIIDDDAAPSLSIDDVSITEGNSGAKNLVFTVSLTAVSGKTVMVNYATANGTARSDLTPADYAAKTGTLSFAPGTALTRTILVPINGDTTVEGNETFFVLLSGATNASVSKARGIGTITNDDGSG